MGRAVFAVFRGAWLTFFFLFLYALFWLTYGLAAAIFRRGAAVFFLKASEALFLLHNVMRAVQQSRSARFGLVCDLDFFLFISCYTTRIE